MDGPDWDGIERRLAALTHEQLLAVYRRLHGHALGGELAAKGRHALGAHATKGSMRWMWEHGDHGRVEDALAMVDEMEVSNGRDG